MKQLTCEMCGSTDLMKQDGVFVCQSCGTKYSVEEAKKMMIEGVVEISGKVEINSSKSLANYIKLIEDEITAKNFHAATEYISKALVIDPDNYELWLQKARVVGEEFTAKTQNFHAAVIAAEKAITKAPDTMKNQIASQAADAICNQMERAIETIFKEIVGPHLMSPKTVAVAISDAADYVHPICIEWVQLFNLPNLTLSDERKMLNNYINISNRASTLGNGIKDVIEWAEKFRNGAQRYQFLMEEKIQGQHPDYSIQSEKEAGGCYIATAIYGSYDCPPVWTLRRFRDYTLAETWRGRAFIRIYYAISPTIIKWFGHTEWFKKMWKGRLDRMVANLNAIGVESTPYVDREW